LFAHSRLAATATSATTVRVAALNDRGDPCVYEVRKQQNGRWTPSRGRVILQHRAAPLQLSRERAAAVAHAPDAEAVTFAVDPFGDIALETLDGALNRV
jgi:hypothetical protein